MKCLRCKKRKAQLLHYLCQACYAEDDGEPRNPGEVIGRLERQRDAYAETLRDLLNFAYERERDYIRERHPELAQEASQP